MDILETIEVYSLNEGVVNYVKYMSKRCYEKEIKVYSNRKMGSHGLCLRVKKLA